VRLRALAVRRRVADADHHGVARAGFAGAAVGDDDVAVTGVELRAMVEDPEPDREAEAAPSQATASATEG
jgi:hypothetical protein